MRPRIFSKIRGDIRSSRFAVDAGVVDAGVVDAGVVDTGGNLPSLSLTPLVNLPPVSLTQVANLPPVSTTQAKMV